MKKIIIIFSLISVCIFLFFSYFQIIQITGSSMEPTLKNGLSILAIRFPYDPQRGNIVIFDDGGVSRVARIIGLPGESVKLNNGRVYIKYSASSSPLRLVEDDYLSSADIYPHTDSWIEIPDRTYYVLSDNRSVNELTNKTINRSQIQAYYFSKL